MLDSFLCMVTMTFVIVVSISYLSTWRFSTAIATIEDQKTKLTLAHILTPPNPRFKVCLAATELGQGLH
jgi:hypothetical protein